MEKEISQKEGIDVRIYGNSRLKHVVDPRRARNSDQSTRSGFGKILNRFADLLDRRMHRFLFLTIAKRRNAGERAGTDLFDRITYLRLKKDQERKTAHTDHRVQQKMRRLQIEDEGREKQKQANRNADQNRIALAAEYKMK